METVEDPLTQVSLAEAKLLDPRHVYGDIIRVNINSKEFGRIATQNAKNVILQKIREEERTALFDQWYCKEKDVVTGIVQRYVGHDVYIDLGKIDAVLKESEQVKRKAAQAYRAHQALYPGSEEYKEGTEYHKISRTHPDLVKRLFESEVAEVKDGIVEIKAIAREAVPETSSLYTPINPNVDPVGACVGLNGARVNSVVSELNGEKIDIINWDENPALLIENALSPAKVIFVAATGTQEAQVIVPDYQLSLAIGKEGQNARLAARLTGFQSISRARPRPESLVSSTRWRLDTSRALRKDCRRA